MKKLLLGAAISAALFGGAANAAITFNALGQPDAATMADTVSVFLSGASAQQELFDRALLDGSVEGLCNAGTVHKFQDLVAGGTSGSLQTAYICEFNTVANGSATPNPNIPAAYKTTAQNLLLYKRAEGGSFQGVGPIFNNAAINFLNVTSNPVACTTVAAGLFASTRNCDYTNKTSAIPTFGVSDVNPQLFKVALENSPKGTLPATIPGPSATTYQIIPAPQQVFGIAVTTKLRNALQEAQFPASSVCNPLNAGYTTGFAGTAESEACMPNLQSDQIAAIFGANAKPVAPNTAPVLGSGKFHDWKQFKTGSGATDNLWDQTTSPLAKPAGMTKSKLHICSRTIGSGTKAQMSTRFLNTGCAAKGVKLVQHADHTALGETGETGFVSLGYVPGSASTVENMIRPMVHAMSSGGGLVECLDELDSGAANAIGSFKADVAYGAAGPAAMRWAIGYNSLDKNANLSKNTRFIKVDGKSPTLKNVVNGAYPDWVEGTFQYNVALNANANLKSLVVEMINSFTTPSVVSFVNTSAGTHSFGLSGFLAVPNAVHPAPANGVLNPAAPVNPFSYAIYPGTGANATDNCRNPMIYNNALPAGVTNGGTQGIQLIN